MRENNGGQSVIPDDQESRADYPLADGFLFYFPDAIAWASKCSAAGNKQHNNGGKLHWDMSKSNDHANKIMRHLLDVGTDDNDEIPHSVKVFWRAGALAQEDLMRRKGAKMPRNAVNFDARLGELAASLEKEGQLLREGWRRISFSSRKPFADHELFEIMNVFGEVNTYTQTFVYFMSDNGKSELMYWRPLKKDK